jgi:hypothetical protein
LRYSKNNLIHAEAAKIVGGGGGGYATKVFSMFLIYIQDMRGFSKAGQGEPAPNMIPSSLLSGGALQWGLHNGRNVLTSDTLIFFLGWDS